ncbi:MAG: hypothetical protein HQ522_06615 [Bacteroidetes bacterium]|nr:hypothetical protein [Bacteroidota bacterium]
MSQQNVNPFHPVNLAAIAEVNHTNNYITIPIDIGNLAPLLYEANIVPIFFIRKRKNARLMGVLTPQVIIRMYQKESFPVRTPSYIPQITIYYALTAHPVSYQYTLFGRFTHHSNGQEGDFYLPDSNINLILGNFATNFVQTGLIYNRFNETYNAAQFYSTSLEVHPHGWSLEEMYGKYNMVRWHNSGMDYYNIYFNEKTEVIRFGIMTEKLRFYI